MYHSTRDTVPGVSLYCLGEYICPCNHGNGGGTVVYYGGTGYATFGGAPPSQNGLVRPVPLQGVS